jgi:serine protease inhibitor
MGKKLNYGGIGFFMKRHVVALLCFTLIAGTAACGGNGTAKDKQLPGYPESIVFGDTDSLRKVKEANPVDDAFISGLHAFATATGGQVLSGLKGNVGYSPYSLYMALALAATGAEGGTREEILKLLGASGMTAEELSAQAGNLFRQLHTDNEVGRLLTANSLWLQKGKPFQKDFTDNAAKHFYASLYEVDFADAGTGRLMSKWISDHTHGLLAPDIQVDKRQIMTILNTFDFKDEWTGRFKEKDTQPGKFHLEDGSQVETDYMNQTTSAGFTKGEGFTRASLGLKNAGSMFFILPDEGTRAEELLSTPEKAAALFKQKEEQRGRVVFRIPKFAYNTKLDLGELLQSKGMVSAFTEKADFGAMTDQTAFISGVKQETRITVEEKGVEAAAYTEINFAGEAAPRGDSAELILDRPFLYGIVASNGTPLFMGVCRNPEESGK